MKNETFNSNSKGLDSSSEASRIRGAVDRHQSSLSDEGDLSSPSSSSRINPFVVRQEKQQQQLSVVETVTEGDDVDANEPIVNSNNDSNRSYDTYTSFPKTSSSPSPQRQLPTNLTPRFDNSAEQQTTPNSKAELSSVSLFDDSSVATNATAQDEQAESLTNVDYMTPGIAGFLEIEEEPPRSVASPYASTNVYYGGNDNSRNNNNFEESNDNGNCEEGDLISFPQQPICTSSGLLLTHRKSATENSSFNNRRMRTSRNNNTTSHIPFTRRAPIVSTERFEVEGGANPWFRRSFATNSRLPHGLIQARRLLSFAKIWLVFFGFVLLAGTVVVIRSFRHEHVHTTTESAITDVRDKNSDSSFSSGSNRVEFANNNDNNYEQESPAREQVFLIPLYNASAQLSAAHTQRVHNSNRRHLMSLHDGLEDVEDHLNSLRLEFEDWIRHHKKTYHSKDEKEKRFKIWSENHHRTIEKNSRHGDCQLMKKPVFGSNHFKDLTPQEFQSQYLTGYNGPTTDGLPTNTSAKQRQPFRPTSKGSGTVLGSHIPVNRHPDVNRRVQEFSMGAYRYGGQNCAWYDISCMVKWLFNTYLYYGVGTMEPIYDGDSYPTSMDWRNMGAVTDVRKQGDCGACWAITAVETVESALYISTGTLVELSESEVILCTDSCNMCYGGWPQDAYEFIMEQGGIYTYGNWEYDADTLLMLSQALEGESDEMNENNVKAYMNAYCPNGRGGGSGGSHHSGSGDQEEYEYEYQDYGSRYGNINGYGYATDRCICYSDGSGCDCDEQNEGLAVRNVATYGPATVCLDASAWQDYDGGILTADSGCSAAFLDMNHCVQVVGYAYSDQSDEEDEDRSGGSQQSGSGSHHSGSGSRDSNRNGYWIVRNQWSENWGMNGYVYISMGENTCGILNDMTQAYM